MSLDIDEQKSYDNGATDGINKTMLHSQLVAMLKKYL
jgi:hypothetical protein